MPRNVNRAPGETQKIEGLVVLRDWKGDSVADASCSGSRGTASEHSVSSA